MCVTPVQFAQAPVATGACWWKLLVVGGCWVQGGVGEGDCKRGCDLVYMRVADPKVDFKLSLGL
jgi:hypothetical protein